MSIKLIVTDLDGTFLQTYHSLNEENVRAVRRAREQGVYVAAVTARNWSACKWAVTQTGFDPLCVINNGAAIVDTKTETLCFENTIPTPAVRAILQRQKLPLMYLAGCFPWNMDRRSGHHRICCNGAKNGKKNPKIFDLW